MDNDPDEWINNPDLTNLKTYSRLGLTADRVPVRLIIPKSKLEPKLEAESENRYI